MAAQTVTRTETELDSFVEALRAQSRRYHDQHPFHVRMNAGQLSPPQLRGWIANRFYYQTRIPIKDALILAKSEDSAFRRLWLRRVVDHDGSAEGDPDAGDGRRVVVDGRPGGITGFVGLHRRAEICRVDRVGDLTVRLAGGGVDPSRLGISPPGRSRLGQSRHAFADCWLRKL